MDPLINLQNTPTSDSVMTESVSFDSNGVILRGRIYKPASKKDEDDRRPAVIVTGAWTTVKEQMAGTYARELAMRGMVALAFDFTGWGESVGTASSSPLALAECYVENPSVKTADILAAARYMMGRSDVDPKQLSGLGICASSGYMAAAVADGSSNLNKLALVAPWLHDPPMAESIYGGPQAAAKLIAQAEEALKKKEEPTILLCGSTTDETAIMFKAPYYSELNRGLIPAYDNKFNVIGWKHWLLYDAQASAEKLSKPLLMVGSNGMALPAGAAEYKKRCNSPIEEVWLGDSISQFDFYDRVNVVTAAADAVAAFFKK